ncbi:4-oxalocrotonate tautomerase family protein [Streptomyces sp. NPDC051567]|uniref:4-oxalocrotonate tautomerase family protein n=1 Tax=Streptomyces sp. NPDC051567 TaxID=3365660 RepID=UPI00378D1061
MPVVTVNWWEGNDRAARRELVAQLTDVVTRVSGCPQESVTVIVRDGDPGRRGKGGRGKGRLADDCGPAGSPSPR